MLIELKTARTGEMAGCCYGTFHKQAVPVNGGWWCGGGGGGGDLR